MPHPVLCPTAGGSAEGVADAGGGGEPAPGGPPRPASVLEALEQRLAKYTEQRDKAKVWMPPHLSWHGRCCFWPGVTCHAAFTFSCCHHCSLNPPHWMYKQLCLIIFMVIALTTNTFTSNWIAVGCYRMRRMPARSAWTSVSWSSTRMPLRSTRQGNRLTLMSCRAHQVGEGPNTLSFLPIYTFYGKTKQIKDKKFSMTAPIKDLRAAPKQWWTQVPKYSWHSPLEKKSLAGEKRIKMVLLSSQFRRIMIPDTG